MIKIDANLMNITLACLCRTGENHIYPVYGMIRQPGVMSILNINKMYCFAAVTNMNRLLVAEFSTPGVLTGSISFPLRNIKSVNTEKTLFENTVVRIAFSDGEKDSELDIVFAQNDNTAAFPYQKMNLVGLLAVLADPEKFCSLSDNVIKEAEKEKEKEEEKIQSSAEKAVTKKKSPGPDPVIQMNQEKEYVLSICKRLETKYGKAEFGRPLTEGEISEWEKKNQIIIPADLREWLKFAGNSRFKGIPLEFYPMEYFQKENDHVVIGKKGDLPIAFLPDTVKYVALDGDSRKNLGSMETILRFWGYDAKELFRDEELEKISPLIEEEKEKMKRAGQNARMPDAGVREAMEYFLIRNNIGYLYQWQTFPKCPLRKEMADCGLVISKPDRDGYYQWKPLKQTQPVDFQGIEAGLGFPLHKDIKELVSSYFYFMLEGDIGEKSFHIYGLPPAADIGKYVAHGFEKENYAGDYTFITDGHFFLIGGVCIDGDDSFALEVNNDNGEVLAVEYMDKKHIKIADSLYELFMKSTPVWYKVNA